MSRRFHQFTCAGEQLAGTLDQAADSDQPSTGLLIVSGGNEIRSGAHAGMARLADHVASQGFPVFRYDRRGIGESSGENREFLTSGPDIAAATAHFRNLCPSLQTIVAFGNCDAATALALFGAEAGLDRLILANPWVIEAAEADDQPTAPPPSAIRARYWERLKNPRTIIDLFKGKIDFRKLLKGLMQATQKQENTGLAMQLRDGLLEGETPIRILLAQRDTTARAFLAAWNSGDYGAVQSLAHIATASIDSASHSFADSTSSAWLKDQIIDALKGC